MKEIYMLAGIGLGMVAGIALYKHSTEAKKVIDKAEKKIMNEADKMEKQIENQIDEIGDKAKKALRNQKTKKA